MPTGSWPDLSNGLLLREVLTVEQPATGFLVREGLVAGGLLELLLAIGFVLFSAQSLWLIFGVLAFGIGFAVFSSLRPYNVPQFWAFVSLSPMAMALFLGVTPWLLMICVGLLLLLPGYLRLEPMEFGIRLVLHVIGLTLLTYANPVVGMAGLILSIVMLLLAEISRPIFQLQRLLVVVMLPCCLSLGSLLMFLSTPFMLRDLFMPVDYLEPSFLIGGLVLAYAVFSFVSGFAPRPTAVAVGAIALLALLMGGGDYHARLGLMSAGLGLAIISLPRLSNLPNGFLNLVGGLAAISCAAVIILAVWPSPAKLPVLKMSEDWLVGLDVMVGVDSRRGRMELTNIGVASAPIARCEDGKAYLLNSWSSSLLSVPGGTVPCPKQMLLRREAFRQVLLAEGYQLQARFGDAFFIERP